LYLNVLPTYLPVNFTKGVKLQPQLDVCLSAGLQQKLMDEFS